MASWKLISLAFKAQRTWARIPPEHRRKLVENASKQARKHGPVIAKQVAAALQQARKGR
jgi:hypothetical protein